MWQAVVGHVWSRPVLERTSWIVGWPLSVAFQNGDGSSVPGQGKGYSKTGWASADDHYLAPGHSAPP
jgi:hypothetical protein